MKGRNKCVEYGYNVYIPSWMKLGFRSCNEDVRTKSDFLHKLKCKAQIKWVCKINDLHTVYLDRDFIGQAVMRLSVAVLQLPALLVSLLRFAADTKRCVP